MKGELTIKDPEYFTLLTELIMDLSQDSISYFIFGGSGVQISIADLLTKHGKSDFKKQSTLDEHLRRTGDIDIYIQEETVELTKRLNQLCYTLQHKYKTNPVLEIGSLKMGKATVNYVNTPKELKGFEDQVARIFEEARTAALRSGNKKYELVVESPEYAIAAKLTGHHIEPKDKFDIVHLSAISKLSGKPIDTNKLKEILNALGKPEAYHAYLALTATREGEKS